MVSLVMLALMAGGAVGLYLKGTLAQGIGMIFNALAASLVAFGFFELASKYLIHYAPSLAPWAPMACFLLLLVLVFALLQAAEQQICKQKIELGTLPERIGRPLAGVVLGYLATGYLLVALAMAPLPSQYPYARFEARNPNPASPKKALFSPDGLVTSLFNTVSKGSFCPLGEPRSFALLHAGYVDQLYLNRQKGKDISLMTGTPALDEGRKGRLWLAPESLRDAEGKAPAGPAGTSLMLVRLGIKKAALKDAVKFTLSQVRLVCGAKGDAHPLAGQGQAVYPLGYVGAAGAFERKSLDEVIDISKAPGDPINIDLGFAVPANLTPVLLEFKRNNVVQLPPPATPDKDSPYEPVLFGAATAKEPGANAQAAPGQPGKSGAGDAAGARGKNRGKNGRGKRGLSDISKSVVGPQGDN